MLGLLRPNFDESAIKITSRAALHIALLTLNTSLKVVTPAFKKALEEKGIDVIVTGERDE